MTRAGKSVFAFGAYLAGGACALIFAPNAICWVLGIGSPDGLWIRLVGMFFGIFAYYCIRAARENVTSFIRWTVVGRIMMGAFVVVVVVAKIAVPMMVVFAVVDLTAAGWTALALRTDVRVRSY